MTSSVLRNHVFMVLFSNTAYLTLKGDKDCTFHLTSNKKLGSHFTFKPIGNTFYYKIFFIMIPRSQTILADSWL